jgi:hypothetical protein
LPILQNIGTKIKIVGSINKHSIEKLDEIDHSW